ncbi:2-dehydropantoate 2-reductase [Frankia sp. Cas4]|uniref:2-dehydropantoate 2-reductase n=1 Tax=Frankia sp. Cas4 TaxID=3073927 RepID=UPI002AD51424|nr:2-dehydropantoate 2-reductase [Frankia sp. Cas4]
MAGRLAVVGVGAVGGFFAARAAVAGADVQLCARRRFDELVVRGPDGVFRAELPVWTRPEQADPVDWVLLATKVHQNAAALAWLRHLVGPDTIVVVAQNGVRHAERVAAVVPADRVLPTVVYINAEPVAPGVVEHHNYGFLHVPAGALADRFAEVLPGAGLLRPVDDFAVTAWTKLTANTAANSLTALTGRRLEVLRRADVGRLAVSIMREAVAVAHADGAAVPADLAEVTIDRLRNQPAGSGTSMLYDRLAGRPLEHEALIGAVVRIGAEHGVPTAVCAHILPLLAAISDAASPLPVARTDS